MSQLFVYHSSQPMQAVKVLNHFEDISSTLAAVGVHFAQWQAKQPLTAASSAEDIVAAYADDIADLKQGQGYDCVEVISMDEAHPEKAELRAKWLDEQVSSADESLCFVSGRALLSFHIDQHVYAVLCAKGALLTLPAGIRHWFDMGERPRFTALRLFNQSKASEVQFTGEKLAEQYPTLDEML